MAIAHCEAAVPRVRQEPLREGASTRRLLITRKGISMKCQYEVSLLHAALVFKFDVAS
jgi:hypothetical protein